MELSEFKNTNGIIQYKIIGEINSTIITTAVLKNHNLIDNDYQGLIA